MKRGTKLLLGIILPTIGLNYLIDKDLEKASLEQQFGYYYKKSPVGDYRSPNSLGDISNNFVAKIADENSVPLVAEQSIDIDSVCAVIEETAEYPSNVRIMDDEQIAPSGKEKFQDIEPLASEGYAIRWNEDGLDFKSLWRVVEVCKRILKGEGGYSLEKLYELNKRENGEKGEGVLNSIVKNKGEIRIPVEPKKFKDELKIFNGLSYNGKNIRQQQRLAAANHERQNKTRYKNNHINFG